MSKIDKTDIENIKLITKEAKLSNLSRIKIKKGDYEIELSSERSSFNVPASEKIPSSNKKISEEKLAVAETKEERVAKFVARRLLQTHHDGGAWHHVSILR